MTGQQGNQSQFNQRSDDAAAALKSQMRDQHGNTLQERKVEVGPDGQPPKPPPPEGSYARQDYDRQRAQQAAQSAEQMQIGQQPPASTPQQVNDGSQAQPLPAPGQTPQGLEAQELSHNAQQRIAKLSQDLRDKDRGLQELKEQARNNELSLTQLKEAHDALQRQHHEMLQSNLDHLDPETRMEVLADAKMQERLASFEHQLMQKIQPQISGLQENRMHDELMSLAKKYPAFDAVVHGGSIESFLGQNPHATVEQAFKAIAEPAELAPRESAAATAVPPVVAPRSGMQAATSRYIPENQPNPEQEMHEEAAKIGQLMRSGDPADHKAGLRMADKNIAERLGDMLPGSRRR